MRKFTKTIYITREIRESRSYWIWLSRPGAYDSVGGMYAPGSSLNVMEASPSLVEKMFEISPPLAPGTREIKKYRLTIEELPAELQMDISFVVEEGPAVRGRRNTAEVQHTPDPDAGSPHYAAIDAAIRSLNQHMVWYGAAIPALQLMEDQDE